MKYYYLVSSFPEVHPDDRKLKFTISDFLEERPGIAPSDWRDVELVLLARDIFLIQTILNGKDAVIPHTLHAPEFWKDQIKVPRETPDFLEDLIEGGTHSGKVTPALADGLWGAYFDHTLNKANSAFLRRYLRFNRDLKNIQAGLRARAKGLPPADYVVGEDDVAEQVSRSNAEDFGLHKEMPWVERLMKDTEDPLKMEDTIGEIYWQFIEEETGHLHFEFDVVLAYLLKLQIIERRHALSEEKGMSIIRQLEEL